MKCKMAGAKARFVLQTLLARDPEGAPSRALVTKRSQLIFSPSCKKSGPDSFLQLTRSFSGPSERLLLRTLVCWVRISHPSTVRLWMDGAGLVGSWYPGAQMLGPWGKAGKKSEFPVASPQNLLYSCVVLPQEHGESTQT